MESEVMTLTVEAEPVPLTEDADGVIRVGGTRVTLDSVIIEYENGATAEEILLSYPSLKLADIYAVISYYLRHRAEVRAYLKQEEVRDAQTRREVEEEFNLAALRDRVTSS
jgi:uncharacterized protein (DUF433 family)